MLDGWPFDDLWYRRSMASCRRSPIGRRSRSRISFSLALAFGVLAPIFLIFVPQPVGSQQRQETPGDEIVANLAAGRVIIAVVKDAILTATIENPVEPQTRIPTPVELGTKGLGIFLGAVEWTAPSSHLVIARLD